MNKMTKAQQKKLDSRIERLYRERCCNVEISVMDIGKVFAEGRKGAAEGLDDAALADKIAAFVNTIRKN